MRKNIITMNILVIFYWMSAYLYVPNLPEYAQSLGANAVVLGIIGGIYGFAMIVLRIPIGIISDNTTKRRRMLLVGTGVLVLSSGILILAQNTDFIIAGRLFAGAAGAWWVVQSSTYANFYNEDHQVKAQGILYSSMNWGKMASALVGGLMAQYLGVPPIFVLSFIIAVACLILGTQLKDTAPKAVKKTSFRDLLPLFRNKDFIAFCIMAILPNFVAFSAPTLFTMVAAKNIGASSFDLGLLNVVFYLTAAAISLFVGTKLYKKIGGINSMAIAFVIGALSSIPLFYHINLQTIYLIQAISGISFGITGSAIAGLVNLSVMPGQRGIAIGLFNCINAVGIFIGPVLVGSITDAVSFDAAYWTLAAISAVSAALCYILIPKKYGKM